MAEALDAFFVTLGLNDAEYKRGMAAFRDDQKRLREEQTRQNRDDQDAQKRLTDGIRGLRNETAGFLFVLAGATGLKSFAQDIISGDAATGRLAKNLGVATEQLSAWEEAIQRVGGSASSIDNALRSMSSAFQSLQLTGTTGHDADLQGLGVTREDLANPEQALLKIAGASQRMSRPEFTARASRLGFDESTITLLAKGRQGVTQLLEEQRRLGVVTDQNAEAAQRFQDRLAAIETAVKGKVRPELEQLVGVVGDWLTKGDNLNTVLTITGGIIAAIAVSAAVAYAPIVALAGAFALVATNIDKLKQDWGALKSWWDSVEDKTDPIFDPVRKFLGMNTGAQAGADSRWHAMAGPLAPGGALGAAMSDTSWRGLGQGGDNGGGGADMVQHYFAARGFTAAGTRGITAAISAENASFDPNATNPTSGAYGIGQWLGDRKRALFAKYGSHPTMQQQLDFMYSEMRGGDRGATLAVPDIQRATTAGAAAKAMIDRFYRPGSGSAGDYARAARFIGPNAGIGASQAGGATNTSNVTSIGQITIHTAATDATGIARDLPAALAQRGLVVQANTGLKQ
jgi:hypothetical protein